ncbi:hypothetical protein FQZ97_1112470 [compost metagenome]
MKNTAETMISRTITAETTSPEMVPKNTSLDSFSLMARTSTMMPSTMLTAVRREVSHR